MLHACVRRFDVTSTVQNFLGTKQGLGCMLLSLHAITSPSVPLLFQIQLVLRYAKYWSKITLHSQYELYSTVASKGVAQLCYPKLFKVTQLGNMSLFLETCLTIT